MPRVAAQGPRSFNTVKENKYEHSFNSTREHAAEGHRDPAGHRSQITLRIHLPPHATGILISEAAVVQGQNLLVETDLRTDLELEVLFTVP